MREAVCLFEKRLAGEVKNNPRAFYAYARSKTTLKERVTKLKTPDGTLTNSTQEACDLLNTEFQKVFVQEDLQHIPETRAAFEDEELSQCDITEEEVRTQLQALKDVSAPGPDGVHSKVLKDCATVLAPPLVKLFQATLNARLIPAEWKSANVTPIFKKGRKQDPLNYRPVSLTSVPCKVLERIIKKRLVEHLENNNLLTNLQHGFRSGRSCLTQLLEYLEELEDALEDGDCVDLVYLDCKKAFDTVPHRRLLKKLQSFGIGGDIQGWIESFLIGRKQRVAIRGVYSEWLEVWSGVPLHKVVC